MRWLASTACARGELRFDVASVRMPRHGGAEIDVIEARVLSHGVAARRASRCQQPVCQWRRRRVVERDHDLVALTGPGSRGRSPGSDTASPPGTAGRGGPRARRASPAGSRIMWDDHVTRRRPTPRSAAITTNATTTTTMSVRRLTRLRNGLNPTAATVPADDGRPRGAGRWRGDDHAQPARQEERADDGHVGRAQRASSTTSRRARTTASS